MSTTRYATYRLGQQTNRFEVPRSYEPPVRCALGELVRIHRHRTR